MIAAAIACVTCSVLPIAFPVDTTPVRDSPHADLQRAIVLTLERIPELVAAEQEKMRVIAAAQEAERRKSDRETTGESRAVASGPAQSPVTGSGACGGDLPPCSVLGDESGGNLTVWTGGCYLPVGYTGKNPCNSTSTASGKWQFTRSTWDGFAGYVNAADAPEAVQDEHARLTWAGGAGCSHWSAC